MRRELLAALLVAGGCASVVEVPKVAPGWTAADAAKPLSHADCVRLAERDAPTAAAWRARLLSGRAALRQAGALANPTASLGWENLGLAGTPVQTTATLAVALASIAQRPRLTAAARFDLDATEADLLAERAKLAADVRRGYDELVAARRRAEFAKAGAAVAQTQREAARKFAAAGESAEFEVSRADAESAKAGADAAAADSEARAKELEFAFALGFVRPVALKLSEGLTSGTTETAEETLLAAANKRPEIVGGQARVLAQLERAHLAAEKLQFLPTVTGGGRREGTDRSAVLSLDVDLPVFDSGAAADDAASAELLAAEAALKKTARDVGAETWTAREKLLSAESFLRDHAGAVAQARRALREKSEKLFAAGELGFDDLVLARRDEIEAGGALLDAELAAALARVDLAAATGRLARDE